MTFRPLRCLAGVSTFLSVMLTKQKLKRFSLQKDILFAKNCAYWMKEGFQETGRTEAERVMLLAQLFNKNHAKAERTTILDLGCGRGRLAQGLIATGQGDYFHYAGIDNNKDDINYCQNTFMEKAFEFHHFDMKNSMYNAGGCKSDELEFPYKGKQFDIIYSWSVFSHLEPHDIDYYLALFRSLLKPDGVVFVTFHANMKCEENPTCNPAWWSFEGGEKIPRDVACRLLVVAYHPDWIKNKLQEYGYKTLFEHYPILASNYQTGYYLTIE